MHYLTVVVLLFALALLWQPFAGRIGVVVGLLAAGLALAMQEVIGAFAGWISILTGRQYRVGDPILSDNAIKVASVTQSITIHPPQPLETVSVPTNGR